jgi:hypothetical protein
MVPKNAQVADLLEALQKKASISDEVMSKVRAYEVHVNKFHKILPPDHSVMSLYDYTSIFVAPFPEDESSKKISVFHFDKEPSKTHGVPFQFALKEVCVANGIPSILFLTSLRASPLAKRNSDSQISPRSRANSWTRSGLLLSARLNIPSPNQSMMVSYTQR